MKTNTVCFIGHRAINETEELKLQLRGIIEKLILENSVDTFLFGSKSRFNSLCYELVTKIKEKYPYIKRIYIRAEFPKIANDYQAYLLENYEDTYYPQRALQGGKAVYVERNFEMIDRSSFCIFYYCENCFPENRKSGTALAVNYAVMKNKKIIILP